MTGENQDLSSDREPVAAAGAAPPPESVSMTRDDILRHDRLLRRALDALRLDNLGGWLRLLAVIVVPLALLSFVTRLEGRFEWGSVTRQIGCDKLRGMSFLGDTMVWPYVILIPLLFVLLNLVISRFERLFSSIEPVLSRRWLAGHAEEYRAMVGATRRIVGGGGGWRTVRRVAVALGLLFFVWNTVTCTWPDRFKPYKTSTPYVDRSGTIANGAILSKDAAQGKYVKIDLDHPIPVPKWDTDRQQGPWSWLSARLWVLLLGYVWIPLVLYKLANLMAATYFFTDRLAAYHGALEVQPLAPNSGGMGTLASLPLALTYPMVVLGIMLAMFFFKENTSASVHNLILLVPFVPVYFAMFFVPLLGVHRAMLAAKQEYQQRFADLFEEVHETFLREVKTPSLDKDEFSRLQVTMKGLSESYERISAMPVWPFEMSTVYRLITSVLIPVAVPLLIKYALDLLLH
jgi:hypothetical protein